MAKKLNENTNTKKDFVQAYNDQLIQIDELKQKLSNPQDMLAQKQQTEVLNIANNVINSNMTETVKSLQNQVNVLLESLVSQVSTGSNELQALTESIDIKKKELKELFDIEIKAYSLTALINSEKQLEIEYDIKATERKNELNVLISDLNGQINTLKDELDNKLADIDSQVLIARKKAMDELEYEIGRKKKVDNDKWEDEKRVRESILEQSEQDYNQKLIQIEKREKIVSAQEDKINEIPLLIEQAKAEGFKDGKDKAEKIEGYKVKAIEAAAKADKQILLNKIEMLEQRLREANGDISQYRSDLSIAYDKLSETAKATVEAGANRNIISKFESALKDKNN